MHNAILKPSSEAERFLIKSLAGKDTGQFSTGPPVPSFRNSLTRIREG